MTEDEINWQEVKSRVNEFLHAALPAPCLHRPFVCEGRPESCTVVVIGENPATRLDTDWWAFWNDETGFDLRKFEQNYESARHADGKRAVSNTRLRLNRLRSRGLHCLEANAFTNEQLGGHGAGVKNTALTQMLLANTPLLKAVIAHGAVAKRYLSTLSLPHSVKVHETVHFRSLSYEELDRVIDATL